MRKRTAPKLPAKNRAKIEGRDHMPVEVATELLCTAGTHLTNTVRKACLDARSTHWQSTLERKPLESKLPPKLLRVTGAQLTKWSRRIVRRRAKMQKAYEHCVAELAKPEQPKSMVRWLNQQKAAIDAVVGTLDAVRDALEFEIDRRNGPLLGERWRTVGHRDPAVQHPFKLVNLSSHVMTGRD